VRAGESAKARRARRVHFERNVFPRTRGEVVYGLEHLVGDARCYSNAGLTAKESSSWSAVGTGWRLKLKWIAVKGSYIDSVGQLPDPALA
jgi:hypothetical protein